MINNDAYIQEIKKNRVKISNKYKDIIMLIILFVYPIILSIRLKDMYVFLSFLVVILIILYIFMTIVNSSFFCPMLISIWVFFYSFMLIAPLSQSNNLVYFPNTILIDYKDIVNANILNGIFLLSFIITYKGRYKVNKKKYDDIINKNLIKVALIISLLILIIFFKNIRYLFKYHDLEIDFNESFSSTILTNYIFVIPFSFIVYFLSKYRELDKKIIYIFFSIVFIIAFYNPFMAKRNYFAPFLLTIFIYLFKDKIRNRDLLALLLVGLIIIFPIFKLITHTNDINISNLNSINSKVNLSYIYQSGLLGLDFDAYSNLIGTMHYVEQNGYRMGKQILMLFLFYIPRKIWINKPINTGLLVGNYLMYNYEMWFNNLSNPIVSEAYIDFGIVGVIIYACLLGYITKKVEINVTDNFSLLVSIFISANLFFVLRGALVPSLPFLIARLAAIYTLVLIKKKVCKFSK